MVAPGFTPSSENMSSSIPVDEVKPWEINPGMSLDEQALRSAFNPIRNQEGYQGPPITKELIEQLLAKYVLNLPTGTKPDDVLLGLANRILHPSVNEMKLES